MGTKLKEGASWVDQGGWFELLRNNGEFWTGDAPMIEQYEDDGSGKTWGVPSDTDAELTPVFATRAEAENHAIGYAIEFYQEMCDDALEQIELLSSMRVLTASEASESNG